MVYQIVSSVCQIQNATGSPLTFVRRRDYNGEISQIKYPETIPSSQWGMFVHYGDPGAPSESVSAVVYRCTSPDGEECDWMMMWSNKYGETTNKVYTEINKAGHYDNDAVWRHIRSELKSGPIEAVGEKCKASVVEVPSNASKVYATFQGIIQPK